MIQCPVCKQDIPPITGLELRNHVLFAEGSERSLNLSRAYLKEAIIRVLLEKPTSMDDLVLEIYRAADQSPQDPKNTIAGTITHLRPALQLLGWNISTTYGGHYGDAVYILEKMSDA